MDALAVHRWGDGPEVALVHGGAGPKTTWAGLDSLAERWTLLLIYRRGFPPSPPVPGLGQDFEIDAEDLATVFDEYRPHVVAHSYGVLGSLLAAVRNPWAVRSLTLIEPPLYFVAPDDPEVARLRDLGDQVLSHGLDTDPAALREFLVLSGSPGIDPGPLPAAAAAAVRRAHHGRLPSQARPDLEALRSSGIPALVASGAHTPALERVCDALASRLDARRAVAPGAGHFVAAAPGFAERLHTFLADGV
ncbi:alpha/beta fold hydrolase [Nocardia sp. NPDC004722]